MEKPPKKLLEQVTGQIRLKHSSYRTEDNYIQWIRRYILFHDKRHPKKMGVPEIEAVLSYLAVECKVAASTQKTSPQRYFIPLSTSLKSRIRRLSQRASSQTSLIFVHRSHLRRSPIDQHPKPDRPDLISIITKGQNENDFRRIPIVPPHADPTHLAAHHPKD